MSLLATLQPPLDRVADPTWQWVVFAGAGVAYLALLVYGVVLWRRGSAPILFFALLGGALSTLLEPMYDLMTRLYMFERGAHILFTIGGRGMQLWAPLGYGVYIGATVHVFHRLASDPTTTRQLFWRTVVLVMCLNLLIEIPATRMNLYVYYGPQPFSPTGFPLYWLFSNIAGAAAAGVLLARVPELTRGPRAIGIVLLVPSCFIGGEVFVQWPAFAAVGANGSGWVLSYAGALVTIVIGVAVLRALAALTAPASVRAPARTAEATPAVPVASPRLVAARGNA